MALVFDLLFKYPRLVFEQGDFTFAASRTMMTTVMILAALAGAALVTYRGLTIEGRRRDRLGLVVLRLGVIALLLFCLLPQNDRDPDFFRVSARILCLAW